ncbi:neutral/alkaline non-lysosomal ceramidase N-terminal domain-containing protein [Clostridium sp.]|uniref:neutral/alkaline non-lysosomal ceramidase N-terminal domain-containing protein n=1 Tax=Clostridium sp. TaxID=1506 RepID=UPI001DA38421|nr:neutral/alkaline non-lysosomal ceramidase N-terminal domain-containing protein [Clostridium sp.]MBS5987797.1 neutral/alkaline non-lysosomal ceramidase N-terminal domain-containing protein [Clostridium sp.]
MKIGFNKIDVTPKKRVNMAGYDRQEKSKGILDNIEINTLVIVSNNTPVIISMLDSIMLEESFCEDIRNYISSEYNIQKSNILIGCIHTHSAPAFFKLVFENTKVEKDIQLEVKEQMIKSIDKALQDEIECKVTYKNCSIEGLYGNRNEKDGWSDKSINILEFYKEDKVICSLLNISVHPTILNGSNLLLSSDLLGWIRKKYSNLTNAPTIICNGTTGDVSTRFYRRASGIDELKYVSNGVIDQIKEKVTSEKINLNFINSKEVEYTTHSDFSNDLTTINTLKSNVDNPMLNMLKKRCELKLGFGSFNINLISSIINLGDVIIVSLPGDVVSTFGKQIKEAFSDYKVIIICYTNTYCNYLVNKEQYGKYFETFNSRCNEGEADIFIDKVIKGVKDLL